MNELSPLAKFIFATTQSDSQWVSLFDDRFREETIPEGYNVTTPVGMFVTVDNHDIKGAFGYRLFTKGVYQIKGVVEGDDFSLLENCADILDKLFDWQNQFDTNAGRPRSNEQWVDPDDSSIKLQIVSMVRNGPIKYCAFADGVNYCNLGGEYEIVFYLTREPETSLEVIYDGGTF